MVRWVSSEFYQQKFGPALALLLLSPLFLAGLIWLLMLALMLAVRETAHWLLSMRRRRRIKNILR